MEITHTQRHTHTHTHWRAHLKISGQLKGYRYNVHHHRLTSISLFCVDSWCRNTMDWEFGRRCSMIMSFLQQHTYPCRILLRRTIFRRLLLEGTVTAYRCTLGRTPDCIPRICLEDWSLAFRIDPKQDRWAFIKSWIFLTNRKRIEFCFEK